MKGKTLHMSRIRRLIAINLSANGKTITDYMRMMEITGLFKEVPKTVEGDILYGYYQFAEEFEEELIGEAVDA